MNQPPKPHRGRVVLSLGIASVWGTIVCAGWSSHTGNHLLVVLFGCFALLWAFVGAVVLVMAYRDLASMRRGEMDSSGGTLTRVGMSLGLMPVWAATTFALMVSYCLLFVPQVEV